MKKVLKWLEISTAVEACRVEAVTSIMDRYGYGGAVTEEEHDEHDRKTFVIRAYLPCNHSLNRKKMELEQELRGIISPGSEPKYRFTEPEEWLNTWKKFFKALNIGKKIVIKPSWEGYSSHPGKTVIEIDREWLSGPGTTQQPVSVLPLLRNIFCQGCLFLTSAPERGF